MLILWAGRVSQSGCATAACREHCRDNEREDGSNFEGGSLVAGI
jgi:hypothetical protein